MEHLDEVLRLMLAHRDSCHPHLTASALAPAEPTDGALCYAIQTKTRKLLPKIMRIITGLPTAQAMKNLDPLCKLLLLLLRNEICPYYSVAFQAPATILFYLVKFLSHEEYAPVHAKVLDVCVELTFLMQQSDVTIFMHLFQDIVALLDDLNLLVGEPLSENTPADVHCFLITGVHMRKDADTMVGDTKMCCFAQVDKHAERIFEIGKLVVPPLRFKNSSGIHAFQAHVLALAQRMLQHSPSHLCHHASFTELCITVGRAHAVGPPSATLFGTVHTLLSTGPLPPHTLALVSTAFFPAVLSAPRLPSDGALGAIARAVSATSAPLLWPALEAFIKGVVAGRVYALAGRCFGLLEAFLPFDEERCLDLLFDLLTTADLRDHRVCVTLVRAMRAVLEAHVGLLWREGEKAIHQFHPASPVLSTKRRKLSDTAPAVSAADLVSRVRSRQSSLPVAWVHLAMALFYDDDFAPIGCRVLLSLRSPEHLSKEEGSVARLMGDRLRVLLERAPSLELLVLLHSYLGHDELKKLPLAPFLHGLKDPQRPPFDRVMSTVSVAHLAQLLRGVEKHKEATVEALLESPPMVQYLTLLCWTYFDKAAVLEERSWLATPAAKVLLHKITTDGPFQTVAIDVAPLLVFAMGHSGVASVESTTQALLDALLPQLRSRTPGVVVAALDAIARLCCVPAWLAVPGLPVPTPPAATARCSCVGARRQALPSMPLVWAALEPLLGAVAAAVREAAIACWVAFFRHMPVADLPPEWVWRFLHLLGHEDAATRALVAANVDVLLLADGDGTSALGAAIADEPSSDDMSDSSTHLASLFDELLTRRDTRVVAAAVAGLGALGAQCTFARPLDVDVFFYVLFRLAGVWLAHPPASAAGVAATSQLDRIVAMHRVSWKQLCVQFPERIHVALIELLLPAGRLEAFLHTFLGEQVSVGIYLKESAPYVLPQLILGQQRELLTAFAAAFAPAQTLSALLSDYIVPIVKEMVMTRTTSLNNVREWQFFFQLLRPDLSIRDVLKYNPLRLLYELVWEFAGDRAKVARNAFDQVSKLLHEDDGANAGKFHLPQQYFLALMTHLGHKLAHKPSRVRAVRCLESLLAMFDTKGMLDPFVPKVMATLKLALQDDADNTLIKVAACRAWHTFVQLLSTSAIETNLLSIVASLLPCVGPIPALFDAFGAGQGVWSASIKTAAPPAEPHVQAMALQILTYLLVEQPIKPAWGQVALLVALVPGFTVDAVAPFAVDHHPLDGVLRHVLALLQHWDGSVREVGLLHLGRLLCTRSRELQDLILLAEGTVHGAVFDVLQALLALSRTETSDAVKALVAQALGALGAIDMARLPLTLARPSTAEHSAKELSCVLIEKLLVNELRAAPQNTDLIALSIQELLKFLAGMRVEPTPSATPAGGTQLEASPPPVYAMSATMPDWMQRRFHQTRVLQIIAPYWSTKYKAPPSSKAVVLDDGTTLYDRFGAVAYETWLTSWCKALIALASPPEKTIFLACRTALGISTQMARFLLPYLVQNVLQRRDAYSAVKREVESVLQDDQTELEVVSSHHHQCAQTVLSMLDTLNEWVWATERKRQAASQQRHAPTDHVADHEKEVVAEFLKDISPALLSGAACKIKAYARGIQYYETHLRMEGISSVPRYSTDGKMHMKPMTSTDIRELQQMYGQLDEPDALRGLSIQRRLLLGAAHTGTTFPDLMHTIVDHEHLARWEDALACYEQAIHRTYGNEVDVEIRSLLYAGVVRCMVQLGRLEGALQHVRGIAVESPDVIPAVYPHALECAWRLSRWSLLQELTTDAMKLKLEAQHLVSMQFARTMLCLQQPPEAMAFHLREARLAIMGPLAAASLESYQRVYPLLHQLHVLHELEQGFLVLDAARADPAIAADARWLAQCPWELRDRMLAPALKFQEPLLALRRVMLQEMALSALLSNNWLRYAKMARKEGFVRTAESAVMHAQALGDRQGIIEQAKLLVHQGHVYEALHVLEPVPVDVSALPPVAAADRRFAAKTLLLATNYMQQSNQKQGQVVLDRYGAVIAYDRKYAKGYFDLAKYYEVLLDNARSDTSLEGGDQYAYVPDVLTNYVLSLQCSSKYLFQSLPRLLTLWYECGDVFGAAPKRVYRLEFDLALESNKEERLMQEISRIVLDALAKLPAAMWLAVFPQVTSRICHPNGTVVDGVKAIMVKVLSTYPQQAMWHILGLTQSLNTQRKTRAMDILKGAQKQLLAANSGDMASALAEAMKLVEELIKVAEFDPGSQRKMAVRIARVRSQVLVPVQAAFSPTPDATGVYIKTFADKADVMSSKEKPKRIQILGSDGQWYPFLCKREKSGDLRKDARMMEFNAIMNKLLQADADGRRRKLRLRTYAVMCLNEESGLMQWVPHTRAMRHLISQIDKTEQGQLTLVRLPTDVKDAFMELQKKLAHDLPRMVAAYRRQVLSHPCFVPRFHQWFLNNFSDPTAWFEARAAFTRSAAVWSMVGHIVGLGDRHGENILIDCSSGECVHVDFDCLFDKGLKLARPEIVPFRLTPQMLDAFGLCGVEGVFRTTSEVTLTLLRANRETLRSVLESFVHDPLVEWSRSKSKQGPVVRKVVATHEQVNSEAKSMLKTIDDRVRGIWNLGKAQHHETLPLSVKGQVDRLISEATADENLAQMYVGWMPFL
ncbi:phosphatidylinositol kinase (PIK-L4) [Achlya hypogyna]|uniref:Serine/threonine-protein kinase ATR n=1 Tax=Achlya hypogyna TaxID=1202772 RepID=A0A1V9YDW2_ACHHY|nr:phosphatidylinositol kinase (PIK-L4) [Achlya hypogyna]